MIADWRNYKRHNR